MDEEQKNNPTENSAQPKVIEHLPQEPAEAGSQPSIERPVIGRHARLRRFKAWYGSHKKLSIPLTVLVLVLVIAAVPWTRYQAAGAVIKKDVSLKVIDSAASTPVSEASVRIGGISSLTNGDGLATLRGVPVGSRTAHISKKYYKDQEAKLLVPIGSQKTVPSFSFEATGRQAKLVVTNLISGKPLAGVDIKVADTTAKTDKDGTATVVLGASAAEEEATLSLDGYNEAKAKVKAGSREIMRNDVTMTPAGKVYFLSKLSGRIDVVKTNLDGTGRETVLAGTGRENEGSTTLLPSDNQKHMILLARRDSSGPMVYIINAADDQLTIVDTANATFEPIGWSGQHFIYLVNRHDRDKEQSGKYAIKSYNAGTGEVISLARSQVREVEFPGNGVDYDSLIFTVGEQLSSASIAGDSVVYAKTWEQLIGDNEEFSEGQILKGRTNGIYSIGVNGSNSKTLRSWKAVAYEYVSIWQHRPNTLYIVSENYSKDAYYRLRNGTLETIKKSDIPEDSYNIYFTSPAGDKTFWDEDRDGRYTLFVGDKNGESGQQLATLSKLMAYGWYGDDYLLVSKEGSELYVIPKEGIQKDEAAIKISNYHAGSYYSYYGY